MNLQPNKGPTSQIAGNIRANLGPIRVRADLYNAYSVGYTRSR